VNDYLVAAGLLVAVAGLFRFYANTRRMFSGASTDKEPRA
jgi:hypothetical protein